MVTVDRVTIEAGVPMIAAALGTETVDVPAGQDQHRHQQCRHPDPSLDPPVAHRPTG
jgi:hypothetical protein